MLVYQNTGDKLQMWYLKWLHCLDFSVFYFEVLPCISVIVLYLSIICNLGLL